MGPSRGGGDRASPAPLPCPSPGGLRGTPASKMWLTGSLGTKQVCRFVAGWRAAGAESRRVGGTYAGSWSGG